MEIGADLSKIAKRLGLENFTPEIDLSKCVVKTADINRPALQLNGFYEHFEAGRIQLIGMVEWAYLDKKTPEERTEALRELVIHEVPCVIFCRSFRPSEASIALAREYGIPFLGTDRGTSGFMAELIYMLNYELAPTTPLSTMLYT